MARPNRKKAAQRTVKPRFPYYRSLTNGNIYAAMSHPAGYEDKRPGEFEGVTTAQFQAHQARNQPRQRVFEADAAVVAGGALGGALGALGASIDADDDIPVDPEGDDGFPDPEFVGTGAAHVPPPAVDLQDDPQDAPAAAAAPPPPAPTGAAPPPPAPGGALGNVR